MIIIIMKSLLQESAKRKLSRLSGQKKPNFLTQADHVATINRNLCDICQQGTISVSAQAHCFTCKMYLCINT